MGHRIVGWYSARIRLTARRAIKSELELRLELNYPDVFTEFDQCTVQTSFFLGKALRFKIDFGKGYV